MNVDIDNHGDSYKLSAAVLVYTNQHRHHAIATKHMVEVDNDSPRIRPGSPFSVADYKVLTRALAPHEQRMVWQDPRLLASGQGRMLWWTPPQKRPLFFQKSKYNADTFDGKGVGPCPGLVWMAETGQQAALYVYAVSGKEKPSKATSLFQAPFFNVWSRGKVCVGNAALPQEDARSDPDAWERMFFGSRFTHPNFTEADRLTKGVKPTEFWRGQLARPSKAFPERVLVSLDLTVGDLCEIDFDNKLGEIPRAQGEF